jgi:hypothetical protein
MIINIVKPREGISCAELRFARQRGGEEIDAVNFQNIIRNKQGKGARTSYGGLSIPQNRLLKPEEYRLENKTKK